MPRLTCRKDEIVSLLRIRAVLTAAAVVPLLLAGPSVGAATDIVAQSRNDWEGKVPAGILLAANDAKTGEALDTGMFRDSEGRPLGTGTQTGAGTEPGRDRGVGPGPNRTDAADTLRDNTGTVTGKKKEAKPKKKAEKQTVVPRKNVPRDGLDTLLDTLRVPGTPGSPTGQGSPGMPGEEPIPGTK